MSMAATQAADRVRPMTAEEKKVIFASSLGTVFEWYDFYLYGSLAAIIGAQFFSQYPEATRNIFALLAFAAGFLVRPFGALVFGRIGDLVGRKYTFLVTILIMGLSTFLVGLLPGSTSIGIARARHPDRAAHAAGPGARRRIWRRGDLRRRACAPGPSRLLHLVDPDDGDARPVPVAARHPVTRTIAGRGRLRRLGLAHSVPALGRPARHLGLDPAAAQRIPAFQKMKDEGTGSKAPLSEAFGQWKNAKFVIIALFGLVAGQARGLVHGPVLRPVLPAEHPQGRRLHRQPADRLVAALGTVGFVLFGWLSDKIGRKPIILAGCLLAALTYFPLFKALTGAANPMLDEGDRDRQGSGCCRPGRLRRPVQPGRHPQVHLVLRRGPRRARRSLGEVHHDGRPGRPTRQDRRERNGSRRFRRRQGLADLSRTCSPPRRRRAIPSRATPRS